MKLKQFKYQHSFGYSDHRVVRYCVVGEAVDFYVYAEDDKHCTYFKSCSGRFKGKEAVIKYNNLKRLHGKDKNNFIQELIKLLESKPLYA